MKKFFRYTFIILLILILLTAGVLWYAAKNTDKILSYIQKNIEQNASIALGTSVNIKSITAGSFPDTSVTITDLQIAPAPGTPALKAAKLELTLGLMDLLKNKVTIKEVKLSDFEISVAELQNTESKKIVGKPSHNLTSDEQNSISVDIHKAEFTNGNFLYVTGSQLQSIGINTLSMNLDGIAGGLKTLTVSDIKGTLNISSAQNTAADLSINKLYARNDDLIIDSARLSSALGNARLSGSYNTVNGEYKSDIKVTDLKPSDLSKYLRASYGVLFSGGQIDTELSVNGSGNIPVINGSLELHNVSGSYKTNTFNNTSGQISYSINSELLKINPQNLNTSIYGINSPVTINGAASLNLQKGELDSLKLNAGLSGQKLNELTKLIPALSGSDSGTLSVKAALSLDSDKKINAEVNAQLENSDFSDAPLLVNASLLLPEVTGAVRANSNSINIPKISRLLPALSEYEISSGEISGNLNLQIRNMSPKPQNAALNLKNLTARVSGIPFENFSAVADISSDNSSNLIKLHNIQGLIKSVAANGSLNIILDDAFRLRDINLNIGQSHIIGGARFDTNQSKAAIFGGKIEGGALGDLAGIFANIEKGALQGNLVRAEGEFRSNNITTGLPSVFGKSYISISDAVFKGVNIGKTVIEKLEEIPLIGRDLTKDLPPEMRESLTARDTNFQSLISSLAVESENYSLSDILIKSDIFNAAGSGEVSADKNLNIRLNVILTPQISEFIAMRVREMNLLVNSRGELEVPVIIKGSISAPSVIPDTSALLAKAAQRTAQDAIGNIIRQGLEGNRRNQQFR